MAAKVAPTVGGLLAVVATLAVATLLGLALQRSGRQLGRRTSRSMVGSQAGAPAAAVETLSAAELGSPLGERATLVQFSSAFCSPCRATRRVLGEVATTVEGVAHIEVDAESHLELVRRLDVRRTPTVLVLDPAGAVVRRASGQPRKVDVIAALGEAVR